MLHLYTGTDREKARAEMNKAVSAASKKGTILRITDANTPEDLRAALLGPGMFGAARVLVLEGILGNEEMQPMFMEALPALSKSEEAVFLYEEKLDADTRRKVEKHAGKGVRHDLPGKGKDNSVFALANALKRGDRKALWVGYQQELGKDNAPEAIHGVLFWGAKQMLLSAGKGSPEQRRGAALVAQLAELPHEARRQGIELEYALEHYILSLPR